MNVTIEDDQILEEIENFAASLRQTEGLDERITLNPVTAVINILDNDGKFYHTCTCVRKQTLCWYNDVCVSVCDLFSIYPNSGSGGS